VAASARRGQSSARQPGPHLAHKRPPRRPVELAILYLRHLGLLRFSQPHRPRTSSGAHDIVEPPVRGSRSDKAIREKHFIDDGQWGID